MGAACLGTLALTAQINEKEKEVAEIRPKGPKEKDLDEPVMNSHRHPGGPRFVGARVVPGGGKR